MKFRKPKVQVLERILPLKVINNEEKEIEISIKILDALTKGKK